MCFQLELQLWTHLSVASIDITHWFETIVLMLQIWDYVLNVSKYMISIFNKKAYYQCILGMTHIFYL